MKILIIGAGGMLGHKMYEVLSESFDVYGTLLDSSVQFIEKGIFSKEKIFTNVDISDFSAVRNVIRHVEPAVIINCVGIVKQVKESKDRRTLIYINSLFPHLLSEECDRIGAKLIHPSTDCVFSGKRGNYTEEDISDAYDDYGRSKYMGEVTNKPHLTIRTSIIGHGIEPNQSLIDWFFKQENKSILGYEKAIFTGFPTVSICREIRRILTENFNLSGLYHVSSDKINKYQLLDLVRTVYGLSVKIIPENNFICDRSLNSSLYRKKCEFFPKTWPLLIEEMKSDYSIHSYYGECNETKK